MRFLNSAECDADDAGVIADDGSCGWLAEPRFDMVQAVQEILVQGK